MKSYITDYCPYSDLDSKFILYIAYFLIFLLHVYNQESCCREKKKHNESLVRELVYVKSHTESSLFNLCCLSSSLTLIVYNQTR